MGAARLKVAVTLPEIGAYLPLSNFNLLFVGPGKLFEELKRPASRRFDRPQVMLGSD